MFKERHSSNLEKMLGAQGGAKRRSDRPARKVKALTHKTRAQAEKEIATKVVKTESKLRKVARLVKGERRYVDINIAAGQANTTGSVNLCNGMNMGDTNGFRLGTDITMTFMKVKGHIYSASSTVANVRLLLVYDKQTNAATPTVNDILTSTDPNAMRNNNNAKRFKILFDKSWAISATNVFPKRFDTNIKLGQLNTHYNTSNVGTIADIVTGSLFWVYLSDVVAGANDPSIDLHSRLWYGA